MAAEPVELELLPLSRKPAQAALLTLNRPDDLNPLDWATVLRLESRLEEVERNPDVRIALIRGRGRAFSAGGDLKAYVELQADPVGFPRFLDDIHRTFSGIRSMSKPVVALVNGVAAAGGFELLLSCDFALAARSARIGDAHVNFGQMGGGGVLTLLPRLIGPARARELVWTGRFIPAEEAFGLGIVNRVVEDGDLLQAGLDLAEEISRKSPLSVANAKQVMNQAWADGTGVDAGLRLERARTAYYCLTSKDVREGLEAFAAKREPNFRGE